MHANPLTRRLPCILSILIGLGLAGTAAAGDARQAPYGIGGSFGEPPAAVIYVVQEPSRSRSYYRPPSQRYESHRRHDRYLPGQPIQPTHSHVRNGIKYWHTDRQHQLEERRQRAFEHRQSERQQRVQEHQSHQDEPREQHPR
ncbi:hypothetical protein [Geopseudomonas aromaticivorans]